MNKDSVKSIRENMERLLRKSQTPEEREKARQYLEKAQKKMEEEINKMTTAEMKAELEEREKRLRTLLEGAAATQDNIRRIKALRRRLGMNSLKEKLKDGASKGKRAPGRLQQKSIEK